LLRVKTHFLGDGLTSLSYLVSDTPLFKSRELGETLAHIWLKSTLGGDPRQSALLSFQIISVAAGMVFVITTLWIARMLFDRARDRLLFVLGMASGGYILLFFGYVEYYSMFVATVAIFGLIGLAISRRKLPRWTILPVLALAIFFHILGVTLIPAAVYLLTADSTVARRIFGMKRWLKLALLLSAVAAGVVVFAHYYQTNYFFRFAFVALFDDRFTAEGYTMLSLKHLADFFNLNMLLLPALPLFLMVLRYLPLKARARRREYRFLGLLLLSTLGAAFIFDPKMGMPRDWDLFSFAGVSLVMSYFFILPDNSKKIASYATVGALSIVLGLLFLGARVATHHSFDASVAQFEHYIALDKKKCAKGRSLLMNYYRDTGDTAKAEAERARWYAEVPEKQLFMNAYAIKNSNTRRALAMFQRVVDLNPYWQDAWGNAGASFIALRNYDSAIFYLRVAVGINPYDHGSWNNLGAAYMYKKDFANAEKALLKAISLNNSLSETHQNLITLYKNYYHKEKLPAYLKKAASRKDTPLIVYKELGNYYLQKGRYQDAGETFQTALRKGLDSNYVDSLIQRYPQLESWLK
jgi:tetratricopeptide (TPR) repeat protein